MPITVVPVLYAGSLTAILVAVLFVPYVGTEYRKHGEFRPRIALIRLLTVLYTVGVLCYVLLPLPVHDVRCRQPQWTPLAALSTDLTDIGTAQFLCNIVLFLPLGALLRHAGRGARAAGAIGALGSLAVELTQLTGHWFLFPCAYRVFDVDDLLANTLGAVLGSRVTLRLAREAPPAASRPRPVTAPRRLLAWCCDAAALWWLGSGMLVVTELALAWLVRGWLGVPELTHGSVRWLRATVLWFAPALLLLLFTVQTGSTPGQRLVLLRTVPRRTTTARHGPHVRALGVCGLALAQGTAQLTSSAWVGPTAAVGYPCLVLADILRPQHRGVNRFSSVDERGGAPGGPERRAVPIRFPQSRTIDARLPATTNGSDR